MVLSLVVFLCDCILEVGILFEPLDALCWLIREMMFCFELFAVVGYCVCFVMDCGVFADFVVATWVVSDVSCRVWDWCCCLCVVYCLV